MPQRFLPRINVDDFCTVNRRTLLRRLGSAVLLTTAGGLYRGGVWASPVFTTSPFTLGVASGDPAPDGFVLWTKLAPRPSEPSGSIPRKAVEVSWAVASDEHLRQVVQQGTAMAHPALGHAVHVEVGGLAPGHDYFYRFTVGPERSPVGRTRTLPAVAAPVTQLRFAVAGCQRYEDGYFTAYQHLAAEHFDFVFHYGDYIYENRRVRPGDRLLPVVRVMPGEPDEASTLDDYRQRYALYKTDPDLQAAHAAAPFIMSYDDHEVDNNWAGDIASAPTAPALFLLRRAAAFQVWYEHMPVRWGLRGCFENHAGLLAKRRTMSRIIASFRSVSLVCTVRS